MRKYLVLGATGHVGSATAQALLERGEQVTIVSHDPHKIEEWTARGAGSVVLDVEDRDALRAALRQVERAFLLNPPAPPSTDTDAQEHRTADSIVAALSDSGLRQVVAESTYGAQRGDALGDLSVLFDFEAALRNQPVPVAILRAAYYMSNWDASVDEVRKTRVLTTPYPPEVVLPMVAPRDIGRVAADLLCEEHPAGTSCVEGPARYTTADVAAAFSEACGQQVTLKVVPRSQWEPMYRALGFSDRAARAYARMTAASVDGRIELPTRFQRGTVSLQAYIRDVWAKHPGG